MSKKFVKCLFTKFQIVQLMLCCCRLEWLEMKRLYKQLQKDQMKKLKGENRTEGLVGAWLILRRPAGQFVSNCLVKVLISEAATVTKDQLRVCLCLLYSVCLLVCLYHGCMVLLPIGTVFQVWFCSIHGYCRWSERG